MGWNQLGKKVMLVRQREQLPPRLSLGMWDRKVQRQMGARPPGGYILT